MEHPYAKNAKRITYPCHEQRPFAETGTAVFFFAVIFMRKEVLLRIAFLMGMTYGDRLYITLLKIKKSILLLSEDISADG